MTKRIFIIILTLNLFIFSKSQVIIKGTVRDSVSNEILPYATIRVLNSLNDSLITATISNNEGKYIIHDLNYGKYIFVCDFIGFSKRKIQRELSKNNNFETLDIIMIPDSTILGEVEILGVSVKFKEQFNKTIFHPDSFDLKSAANAFDILKNLPGVQVDQLNSSVTLAGETNTLVLIDNIEVNRQKPLFAVLPEDIERIEIINNPSSKYDGVYTGVINVILKKAKNTGFRLSNTTGALSNFGLLDLGLEYSKEKFRFFVTNENKYRLLPYNKNEERVYKMGENTYTYYSEEINSRFQKVVNTFLFSMDYFINSNNTINLTYRTDIFNYLNRSTQVSNSNFNNVLSNQTSTNKYDGNEGIHNVTLYYKKIFKNPDKELTADINYYILNSKDISSFYHHISYENPLNVFFYNREEDEKDQKHSFNVKVDYTGYINDNLNYETGCNFYKHTINNVFNTYQKSNIFDYNENRISLFNNWFFNYEKMSYWAGIRYEYSSSIIDGTNSIHNSSLLPNLGVLIQLSKTNKISISYNKYLTRPDIWQLNPFIYYSDSLNSSGGNPFLVPSNANNLELKHTFFKHNKQISTVIYYNWYKDLIDNVIIVGQNSETYETFKNITENVTYGVKMNLSFTLLKKWKLSAFLNGYYYNYKYVNRSIEGFGYDFSLTSSLELPKSFFAGFHMYSPGSKKYNSQGYVLTNQKLNQIYIGKSIFKDKGKIYFIIFNLLKDKSISYTNIPNYNSVLRNEVNSLSAGIYFTYLFRKGKLNQQTPREYNMEKDDKNKY